MPPRVAPPPPPVGSITRLHLLPGNVCFNKVFTDADLTHIQKIKQWINVVVYSCGKTVQRQERMAEAQLVIEMNKAYYLRLQVIFADVDQRTSYWASNFDFDLTFVQMMTHTFGSGSAGPTLFFDYEDNENLDVNEVDTAKTMWTNPYLWKKYADLKSEMQSQLLPVLLKQRIKPCGGGDSGYEWKSGGSWAEVTWSFLGALFQVC
jgi:hypothetical protein